jgi:hypothetical protein
VPRRLFLGIGFLCFLNKEKIAAYLFFLEAVKDSLA